MKFFFIVSVFNLRLPCEQHLQIQPGGSSYKAVLLQNGCFEHKSSYKPLLLQNGCFEHKTSYKPLLSKTVGFEHKSSHFNPEHQVDTLEELVASDDFSWGIELNTAEHQLFSTSEVTLRLSTTKM